MEENQFNNQNNFQYNSNGYNSNFDNQKESGYGMSANIYCNSEIGYISHHGIYSVGEQNPFNSNNNSNSYNSNNGYNSNNSNNNNYYMNQPNPNQNFSQNIYQNPTLFNQPPISYRRSNNQRPILNNSNNQFEFDGMVPKTSRNNYQSNRRMNEYFNFSNNINDSNNNNFSIRQSNDSNNINNNFSIQKSNDINNKEQLEKKKSQNIDDDDYAQYLDVFFDSKFKGDDNIVESLKKNDNEF